uniref:Uncharacterized protein n=1 Tax=viral metagenome TaxID=1070528 RepID=A0A6M3X611_9ZZZZ
MNKCDQVFGRCVMTWNRKKTVCDFTLKLKSEYQAGKIYDEGMASVLGIKPEDNEFDLFTGHEATLIVYPQSILNVDLLEEHKLTIKPIGKDAGIKKIVCPRAQVTGIENILTQSVTFTLNPRMTPGGKRCEYIKISDNVN